MSAFQKHADKRATLPTLKTDTGRAIAVPVTCWAAHAKGKDREVEMQLNLKIELAAGQIAHDEHLVRCDEERLHTPAFALLRCDGGLGGRVVPFPEAQGARSGARAPERVHQGGGLLGSPCPHQGHIVPPERGLAAGLATPAPGAQLLCPAETGIINARGDRV